MKGKWAKGIEPRNFNWVLKDSLAYSERPGGHTANHRRVRRHEEIVWIREHGFNRIVSILGSPHNLHAYDEMNVPYAHVPFGGHDDAQLVMSALFPQLRLWLDAGEKVLMHADEVSDKLQGIVGGYLLYTGKLATAPQAITVVETLMSRQLGEPGREIIVMIANGMAAASPAEAAIPTPKA